MDTPQYVTDANKNIVWENQQEPFGEYSPLTFASLVVNTNKQGQMAIYGVPDYSYVIQMSTNLARANWVTLATNSGPIVFTDTNSANAKTRFYRAYYLSTPNSSGFVENLRYPGQYFDFESGLNYNLMRDYDPSLGRYVEPDPTGLNGGLNLYGYAGENPLSRIDPYGLEDLLLMPRNDRAYKANNEYNDPAYYTVGSHGSRVMTNNGMTWDSNHIEGAGPNPMTVEDVGNAILDPRNKWDRKKPIKLMSCGGGYGGNQSFAAKLAKYLSQQTGSPITVIASPTKVWLNDYGNGNIIVDPGSQGWGTFPKIEK